jgi:PAT family beta-lactamase induction signal transducer AmpG
MAHCRLLSSRENHCAMHISPASGQAEQTSFFRHLFSDRRIAAMLVLGFSSGIPYLLVYATQSAWLSEAKVPIETIGLLSELTLAYKFKWVWAPFLDEYDAPIFSKWLGRRRGWIVLSQIAVMAALCGVAFGDPANWLWWTIGFSVALGVAGATQDITIDGWRITATGRELQPLMSSTHEMGYRVGVLAAGAGALYLADAYGWKVSYMCMAGLMTIGMVAAFLAPEPPSDLKPHREKPGFVYTITAPIKELWTRLGSMAIPILLMIAGFRMPGYVAHAMAIPLFKHLEYTDSEIATVTKIFGFGIAIAGTFFSAFLVRKLGMMSSLLIGTVFGSASHLSLAWLAANGHTNFWAFALAVGVDGFAASFATVVLITYMSSLASTELAASQYALMTSICALPGSILAGASGFIIKQTGFTWFFVWTSLIGLPVAALAWWVWRKQERLHLHLEAEDRDGDGIPDSQQRPAGH